MKNKKEEIKTKIFENNQTENKEYSIYEYLKNNSTILLTLTSTMIAIVTFFAKLVTLVSARKELAFWEFSDSYATFGSESIVYTAILAIIYSCVFSASLMLFTSTYETYLSRKKYILVQKYSINKNKSTLKELKKKSKNNKITEDETNLLEDTEKKKKLKIRLIKEAYKDLFYNFFLISLLISGSNILFTTITAPTEIANIWWVILILLVIQLSILWALNILTMKNKINKNELKKRCNDVDFTKKIYTEYKSKEYPIVIFFKNGLRPFLSNSNIISICIIIILNCLIQCSYFTLIKTNPIEKSSVFQITTIDSIPYVIVYQDENKYFLEEFEVKIQETEGEEHKEILTVYTNKQRIITCDDITIEVKKYDDVNKEYK